MEEFYKAWFKLQQKRSKESSESESDIAKEDDTNTAEGNEGDLSKIIYETKDYSLIVERSFFKRQKNFRLDDHLLHIKLITKDASEHPLLTDLLDFLHAGLIHLLDEIKKLYKKGIY